MKKALMLVSMLTLSILTSSLVCAENIRCTFTEPFVTTIYNGLAQSLTIEAAIEKAKVISNVVFLQTKKSTHFELIAGDGTILQQLDLNYSGSDGMSDHIYPYEVKDFAIMGKGHTALIGGCISDISNK